MPILDFRGRLRPACWLGCGGLVFSVGSERENLVVFVASLWLSANFQSVPWLVRHIPLCESRHGKQAQRMWQAVM